MPGVGGRVEAFAPPFEARQAEQTLGDPVEPGAQAFAAQVVDRDLFFAQAEGVADRRIRQSHFDDSREFYFVARLERALTPGDDARDVAFNELSPVGCWTAAAFGRAAEVGTAFQRAAAFRRAAAFVKLPAVMFVTVAFVAAGHSHAAGNDVSFHASNNP